MEHWKFPLIIGTAIFVTMIPTCCTDPAWPQPPPEVYSTFTKRSKKMSYPPEDQQDIPEHNSCFPYDDDLEPCQNPFPGYKKGYLKYDKICGPVQKKVSSRIVGGQETKPHEFCFEANIYGKSVFGNQTTEYFCGGSAIGEHYILTAAHCCVDKMDGILHPTFWIQLGAVDIFNNTEPSQKWFFSNESYPHPDFDITTIANDACLIKIKEPIKFTPEICPICYPGPCSAPGQLTTKSLIGSRVVVTGHGLTSASNNTITAIGMKITTQIVSLQKCNPARIFDRNHYCTLIANKSTCYGDSGSPVMQRRFDGYRYYWMCLCPVSFGEPYCIGMNGCTKLFTPLISNWIETVTGIMPKEEKQIYSESDSDYNTSDSSQCSADYNSTPLY